MQEKRRTAITAQAFLTQLKIAYQRALEQGQTEQVDYYEDLIGRVEQLLSWLAMEIR